MEKDVKCEENVSGVYADAESYVPKDPNMINSHSGVTPVSDFSYALKQVRSGKKISRLLWLSVKDEHEDIFVVYQKGYPDGIPCNRQTAEAWGLNEGDLFKVKPYLQIRNADGTHSMWQPSVDDILAKDWFVY